MRPPRGLRSALAGFRRRAKPASQARNARGALLVDGDLLTKLDRLSLALGRDLLHGLMGEHRAVRRTSGIEFADYRQYSPGDDLRRVDWNVYARSGTMQMRQAQAEQDTVLYILVDASPSMLFGEPSKFEAARRLAAAFGYVALSHLDSVVLAAPGSRGGIVESRLLPGAGPYLQERFRGRGEAGDLFRSLQTMETGEPAPFDNLLAGWGTGELNGRGAGRIAIVISDLLLDNYKAGVKQLASMGFGVTVLQMLSPEELSPPADGDLELLDCETGEQMEVHLNTESLHEYRRRLTEWLQETEGWCRRSGARYLLVQSDWDVERVMLDTLRRMGVTL